MPRRSSFGLFCLVILGYSASAQTNIGGTINVYTPVQAIDTSGCTDMLTVGSAVGFAPGDTVLIIQMKGASVDSANSSSFGTVTALGAAGNYEFSSVAGLVGNQVLLSGRLQHTYSIQGRVQLVKVPVYSSAIVGPPLTAPNWNGSTGGVLVLFVSGTLTLNSDIDLDGEGFRGGNISNNPDGGCGNNSINDYFYDVYQGGSSWLEGGAEKGESVAEVSTLKMGGKGKLASGGGGGNKHNTGGGGGANYTSGGKGGNEMVGCSQNANGGIGGAALPYSTNKVFLGGGGGCGDFNNNVGTVGTNGGGLIIIKAQTVVGNNYSIKSNGLDQNGFIGSIGDGAGGGGAGGTILLDVQSFSGNLTLQVNGGDGGDQTASNAYGCFGPGGGGGTGIVLISAVPCLQMCQFKTLQVLPVSY